MNRFLIIVQLLAPFLGMGQAISFGAFGSGMNNAVYSPVRALFHDTLNNKLYAGGQFASAGGKTVWGAAVWQNSGWDSLKGGLTQFPQMVPNSSSMGPVVFKIIRFQNKIYYAGAIDWVNGKNQYHLAIWDGTTWEFPIAQPPDGPIKDLKVHNGKLYACGLFTKFGNTVCKYVAQFDGVSWQPVGDFSQYSQAAPAQMNSIGVYNNEIYVGGLFTDPQGAANCLAKFNGTSWATVGSGIQQGGMAWVSSMEEYNSKLYLAGYFDKTAFVPGEAMVAWNGSSFENVGVDLVKGGFRALHKSRSKLFVVGLFYEENANGSYFPGIKYINENGVCTIKHIETIFTNTLNYSVDCLETMNDSLILGGQFLYLDTVSANNIGFIRNYEINSSCAYTFIPDKRFESLGISLYPNPVNESLKVDVENEQISCSIKIFNLHGQLLIEVQATESLEIDVSALSKGLYFVEAKIENRRRIYKIIKQ